MLVTIVFSFSHNVFYFIKDRNIIFVVYCVVCKCFQFGLVSSFGNGLKHRICKRYHDIRLLVIFSDNAESEDDFNW